MIKLEPTHFSGNGVHEESKLYSVINYNRIKKKKMAICNEEWLILYWSPSQMNEK